MGYIIKDTAALVNSKLTDAGRKRISEGTLPGGVSSPASHTRTLLVPRAESRFARTLPADPPPTII